MGKAKSVVKSNKGRPTVMTDDVIAKLEQAFKMGLTDVEACCYAEIEKTSLYRYQEKHPDFCNKKEQWKQNPVAKAKKTIFDNLDDPKTAQWYLERVKKDEFSTMQRQEILSANLSVQKIYVTKEQEQEAQKHIDDVISLE